ncbi:MAG: Ion transport protein-domain-containing protein [Monoraphidium minutum]|nr:MAG: Ion transport protein-domain-containing protein [Monoraphidium minutum]
MFGLILLNCAAMAYEYPGMDHGSLDYKIIHWSDVGFTIAFGLEAGVKILAFTFRGYIAATTNKVDLLIVITSAALLVFESSQIEAIKALRVLRAAKPLRALTRSAGMRLVFKSVTMSLAAMANVSVVVMLFFLIFAILGVQLFSGKFYSCNDTSVPDVAACTGTFVLEETGEVVPRLWENAGFNFDHLGSALVSLFVVATLNGYSEIMDTAMAAPEEKGMQPQPMINWAAFFFFVAFVVVVSYTLLNLYIGVVFFQFSRIRQQSQNGSAFLTNEQQEWAELSKMVFRLKPLDKCPVPKGRTRRALYYTVQSHLFEGLVTGLIILNALLMATTHYGMPDKMVTTVEFINYAFTCVFITEAIIKVVGLGWANYWKVGWNRFDLLLVASSLADMLVSLIGGANVSALKIQKVMRLLRLARVVKLVRGMKGVRSLFGTLIVSMPAFWNVGALLGLLFYIYAYIGTLLLGTVKHNEGINEHANFERFWMSLLTLLRLATNDDWTNLFAGCRVQPPYCDPAAGECGTWVAIPFFLSFVLLVSIVMLNLFTAVIIENFEKQQEQEAWRLNPHALEEFVELWSEYDDGTGSIDPQNLEALLLRLPPPLGLGPGAEGKDVLRFVFDLDIPLVQGRVPFHRTVFELVKRCSGTQIPEGLLKDQIDRLVARAFKGMRSDEVLNFSVAVTVMRVQRKWRARMRAAKLKRKKETRAERGVVPTYADIVAARDTVLRQAIAARQEGDRRWRPAADHARLWDEVEAAVADERAADEAAAAEAAAAAALAAAASASGEAGGGRGARRLAGGRAGISFRYPGDAAADSEDEGGTAAGGIRLRTASEPGGAVGAAFRRIARFFGSGSGSVVPAG